MFIVCFTNSTGSLGDDENEPVSADYQQIGLGKEVTSPDFRASAFSSFFRSRCLKLVILLMSRT